jgi:hypothetical protein
MHDPHAKEHNADIEAASAHLTGVAVPSFAARLSEMAGKIDKGSRN